jgi:hypothetical protein
LPRAQQVGRYAAREQGAACRAGRHGRRRRPWRHEVRNAGGILEQVRAVRLHRGAARRCPDQQVGPAVGVGISGRPHGAAGAVAGESPERESLGRVERRELDPARGGPAIDKDGAARRSAAARDVRFAGSTDQQVVEPVAVVIADAGHGRAGAAGRSAPDLEPARPEHLAERHGVRR